jgi:hypothetical protein
MKHFICVTCGTQFAATAQEPENCPICLDERQYVGHGGQKWTTLDEYAKTHRDASAGAGSWTSCSARSERDTGPSVIG